MGRIGRSIATGLLATTFANSGCGAGELFGDQAVNFSRDSDSILVVDTVRASMDFWAAQKIGTATTAKVVTLGGGEVFRCGSNVSTSVDDFSYCESENTIVAPALSVNELRNRNTEINGTLAIKGLVRITAAGVVQKDKKDALLSTAPIDEEEVTAYEAYQRACIGGLDTSKQSHDPTDSGIMFRSFMASGDGESIDHRLVAFAFEKGVEEGSKQEIVNLLSCTNLRMEF